jgi:putative peptidoglycan lipid II flippase
MRLRAFIQRLWNGETEGVAAAAALISIASFTSRLFGLVRDRLLATSFGAGRELDAYYAAFRLPDFLYNLLILGALSAGFIPLFTELKERKGLPAALRFTSQTLSLIGSVLVILCVAGIIAAPAIVPLLARGFGPEKQALTATLTRIMFLSPLFLGISAIMGGVLQSSKRFFAFAFAPIFYNLGIIVGIVFFTPWLGLSGLAWGVVLGAFAHGFVQYLAVRPIGALSLPWPSFAPEPIRRMVRLMLPRTAGLAVAQVNLVIILFFASSLGEGSVSVFNLAGNLQSFPLGLIGISFAVAAFPVLAEAVGAQRSELFLQTLHQATRRILYFILPLCVLFIVLRAQIVRVVLGDGRFDWNDTRLTLEVFALLTLALPAQALTQLFARAFYALQEAWLPFLIACLSELTTAAVAWASYRSFGVNGLALAIVAGSVVNIVLLLCLLRRKMPVRMLSKSSFRFALIMAFALGLQALVTYAVNYGMGTWFAPLSRAWMVLLQGAVAGMLGGLTFLFVTTRFALAESELIIKLKSKLFSRFAREV